MHTIIVFDYFRWHYTSAFSSIWRTVNNFVYFFYHLFSIPLLLHTLFEPWKQMTETKKSSATSSGMFERVFGNMLVRIVGICIRTVSIFTGLAFCLGVLICGVIFTIFWVTAPVVILFSFGVGVRLII